MFVADDDTIALLRQRWQSLNHVGEAKPWIKGWVRSGRLKRTLKQVPRRDVHAHIPNWEGSRTIWLGEWDPQTPFVELPNIQEVQLDGDLEDQQGVTKAEISIDNIGVIQHTGVAGIYHTFERGYYAPFRGHKPRGRAPVGTKNSWYDLLNDKSSEIVICAGYGQDCAIPVFKGLVDNIDLTSRPDAIKIDARDMGQFLTDQRVFINAKVRHVKDPITFADRRRADNTHDVRGGARASSHRAGKSARFAVDGKTNTDWLSDGHNHRGATEWIEMDIPAGRYESIRLNPAFGGMECYIAIHAKDHNAPGGGGARRHYGGHLPGNQWVDEGKGNVPGTGIPFVKHIGHTKSKAREYWFPQYGYLLGDDSKIRLFFTNLQPTYQHHNRRFRAGVTEFAAIRRKLPKDVKRYKWILVDDVSDIVKTVLQWCGLTDWEVETTGVRLKDKLVYNRANFLMEIIQHFCEETNYVFYMKPPTAFDEDHLGTNHNLSMGVPVFRNNHAMRRASECIDPIESVNQNTTLQGISAQISGEPLAYNIRVRGKRVKKRKGGRRLGEDMTRRYMYVYRPPWSREKTFPGDTTPGDFQNANLKNYEVHYDEMLNSVDECKIACLFIAFREALESAKGQIEFPAFFPIYPDHQTSVRDLGTGLSTRIWVVTRSVNLRTGEQAQAKMSIGGSLIDLPDTQAVREELVHALRNHGYNPGLSRWELDIARDFPAAFR